MNIGKVMPIAAVLVAFAASSTAFAQSPRTGKAQFARQDPYQAQKFAAMKRSTGDPAFRAALNNGRAVEAK